MNVNLWEWYFDAIVVEGIINSLEYFAVIQILRKYIHPHDDFQYEGRISEFLQYHLRLLRRVETIEAADGRKDDTLCLLDVCAIRHTDIKNVTLITMIACHILIVLGDELRVLECYHRTISSINSCGYI